MKRQKRKKNDWKKMKEKDWSEKGLCTSWLKEQGPMILTSFENREGM